MDDQRAELEWRDNGVPVSTRFDDPYFSVDDGLAETRHVFLAGNDLPARFHGGFHIAELGFGTGLNLLTTLQSFMTAYTGGQLHFTSFEAFPMTRAEAATALDAFPEHADLAAPMLAAWDEAGFRFVTHDLRAEVIVGDARQTLPRWDGRVDAWFLDGFSPAKNPELWGPDLLAQVGQHTKTGGSFATYTAAGHVRRSLQDAGFDVQRVPGFGRKRHMTIGTKI